MAWHGTSVKPRRRFQLVCKMCGTPFFASREDALTDTSSCRSSLRRWVARYGFHPAQPPGRANWYGTVYGRICEDERRVVKRREKEQLRRRMFAAKERQEFEMKTKPRSARKSTKNRKKK
jgi:hypothetical protein